MIPLLAGAAMVAAFNLVCAGQTVEGEYQPGRTLPSRPDFTHIFRIDLALKRYCIDRCDVTAPLERVEPTLIVFRTGVDAAGNTVAERVSRETGEYLYVTSRGPWRHAEAGTCTRAPFTGFPVRQF